MLLFRNLIEINSSFDQRGKRHLVNYFTDAFVQAKIIKHGFNIGHDYQYPVVEKFYPENSGKKRIQFAYRAALTKGTKFQIQRYLLNF